MKAPISLRKVDRMIRVENSIGNLLAVINPFDIKFFEPVTEFELTKIASIASNYELWIENLIEEV